MLLRQNQQNVADAQGIINRQAAGHRAREAALRREIADLREQLAAEQGRRRHSQFLLARSTH